MEPAQKSLKTIHTVFTRVVSLLELDSPLKGWYVLFEGSHERLFFGPDKPDFDNGSNIKVTFARVTNEQDG